MFASMDTMLGIAGLFLGIVSFAYAIYQQQSASHLTQYRIKTLRAGLKECILVMSQSFRLMVGHDKYKITDPEALKRISAVHITSASLIKSIFRELSEIDRPYNEEKLLQYVASGLITSKWVWYEAYTFVQENTRSQPPSELPENTRDYLEDLQLPPLWRSYSREA